MTDPRALWAFLGLLASPWKLAVVVAAVAWLVSGRRGRGGMPHGAARVGDRLFVVLLVLAATAVAAWVVTRTLIAGGGRAP